MQVFLKSFVTGKLTCSECTNSQNASIGLHVTLFIRSSFRFVTTRM